MYADDPDLFRAVAGLLVGPLAAGDTVVAVATPAHLFGLDAALWAAGAELDILRACGRWIELDASDLLAGLLVGDVLDPRPLIPLIAHYEAEVSEAGGRLHVFSEMAPLLWERGLGVAALELEDAGNHLQGLFGFDLICGWPGHTWSDDDRSLVCSRHTQATGRDRPCHEGRSWDRTTPPALLATASTTGEHRMMAQPTQPVATHVEPPRWQLAEWPHRSRRLPVA